MTGYLFRKLLTKKIKNIMNELVKFDEDVSNKIITIRNQMAILDCNGTNNCKNE
jgi:hypothetical protein